jgi:putative OPT family oligopeptide transporter
MHKLKGQLTLRGVIIGCVGCVIITAASVYTALKMGALPWPIIFAAIISLFFLKALGRTSLNEANVTHTVMSAGAMVAGGLTFTIPGIWMLGHADEVFWWQMLIVAIAGVALGLLCTALLRRHFVEKAALEFPIGQAAAQTLIAGDSGGKTGAQLFGAMGFAGVYTFLRDWLGAIPAMFFNTVNLPGVAFGIYNSPMLLAVGFLVGTTAVVFWFVGALLGNFGIILGGTTAGLWDTATGQSITASLGMGVMMGCGFGVIVKILLPRIPTLPRFSAAVSSTTSDARGDNAQNTEYRDEDKYFEVQKRPSTHTPARNRRRRSTAVLVTIVMAAVALLLCLALGFGPLPSIAVVVLVWVTTAMSSQSVGQTGIDPMEIFGLIALLLIAAFADMTLAQLFFVAGIVAVACGLAGDVMNDFKAGHILGTDPRAQWIGQAIGGVLGALVAVAVMAVLLQAYGPQAFGPQGSFISAQASVVATMVSGIPSLPAFIIGLISGFALYLLGMPAMMLGLGIYLPFYLSLSAFLGAMAKVIYDQISKRRQAALSTGEATVRKEAQGRTGLVIASGLLGGESVVGVLVALTSVIIGLST